MSESDQADTVDQPEPRRPGTEPVEQGAAADARRAAPDLGSATGAPGTSGSQVSDFRPESAEPTPLAEDGEAEQSAEGAR